MLERALLPTLHVDCVPSDAEISNSHPLGIGSSTERRWHDTRGVGQLDHRRDTASEVAGSTVHKAPAEPDSLLESGLARESHYRSSGVAGGWTINVRRPADDQRGRPKPTPKPKIVVP